jgi:hypothetical protein
MSSSQDLSAARVPAPAKSASETSTSGSTFNKTVVYTNTKIPGIQMLTADKIADQIAPVLMERSNVKMLASVVDSDEEVSHPLTVADIPAIAEALMPMMRRLVCDAEKRIIDEIQQLGKWQVMNQPPVLKPAPAPLKTSHPAPKLVSMPSTYRRDGPSW